MQALKSRKKNTLSVAYREWASWDHTKWMKSIAWSKKREKKSESPYQQWPATHANPTMDGKQTAWTNQFWAMTKESCEPWTVSNGHPWIFSMRPFSCETVFRWGHLPVMLSSGENQLMEKKDKEKILLPTQVASTHTTVLKVPHFKASKFVETLRKNGNFHFWQGFGPFLSWSFCHVKCQF